jgi:hypothetical protein
MTIYKSAKKTHFHPTWRLYTSSKLGGVQCKVHIHDFQKIQIPQKLKISTLVNSTLFILFYEMLEFSNIISSKSTNVVKENSEYLGMFHLLKWMFQN